MADDDRVVNYRFDCAALGQTVPPLRYVRLVESLNEPFALRVDFDLEDITVELENAIGADAVLQMWRGTDAIRRVCGVVKKIEELDVTETRRVRFHVVPALEMLSQIRNTRIFQEMTVPEILTDVLGGRLGEYNRAFVDELEKDYPKREYCVQYQETDLDFCHRLMEEEGIGYTFDHEADIEDLILRDSNMAYPEIYNGPTVTYMPISAEVSGLEPVVQFMRKHRPTITKTAVRDWDWTKGGNFRVEGEEVSENPDGRERESYEHSHRGRSFTIYSYDQGARRYQKNDSATQPKTRQEAHQHEEVRGTGHSLHLGMRPGIRFDLSGHPAPACNDSYLVTKVVHESLNVGASLPGAGDGIADQYYNTLECIPSATPYRPYRVTPKPYIPSVQTAVVTGPGGEEIHVDEHGRIKVQFHWDREGNNDEHSSCWMRVQQPWAGAGWGFWWVPRIGMEVLVHFVNGDPDRPLVTSSVYDGANPTPYSLPDEKTKSTIKSNSSIGGGGFNEFRFEDKKGEEEIYTHAQKDYNEVVENDHNTLVHHDQTNTVDNDQTQEVHVDQTETVNRHQTMIVDGDRTVVVHTNFDETVDGTETRHTVGDVTETFEANETRTVAADLTEDITGNETRKIMGNQSETISGSHSQSITGSATETITGSLSETVVGGITTTTPAAYNITAVAGMTVTAPGGVKLTAPGGTLLIAPGGVMRIDQQFDWSGMIQGAYGGIELKTQGMKIGVVYFSMGITGVKLEDCANTFANEGIKLWNETLDIEQKGFLARFGIFHNWNEFKIAGP